jgi:perosamine synthetase
VLSAPQPRSRLYTTMGAYARAGAGALGIGYEGDGVEKLERALERLHPGRRAIAVPMARVGLYLTLKHLIRPGQKVILSPYTIADVVNMVLCAGGIPVFADIERGGSCNIDADHVIELLDAERDVGAVLVTHFYGLVCNIEPILAACRSRGIPLVEDAAQSFGARLTGVPAGSFGRAGVFSFGLLKNVTGFFGGAVVTEDSALERAIRAELATFRVFPRQRLLQKIGKGAAFDTATFAPVFQSSVYWLFRFAYLHGIEFFKNQLDTDADPKMYASFPARYACRLSGAQANVILTQLGRVAADAEKRIAKAQLYHEGLKDVPGLVLPPLRRDGSHVYLYYPIQCEDRDRLARSMTRRLRDVQVSHHRNCASMACFSAFARNCPEAERAGRNVLYLPTYPSYREDQVRANIETIRAYFRETNACAWR